MSETMEEQFTRWLSDGTSWIGIFQNQLMEPNGGPYRIAMVFDINQIDKAEIGKTRAPDTKQGTGWRYILVVKAQTVAEALEAMTPKEESA